MSAGADPDAGSGATEDELVATGVLVLLAGQETSSNLVANVLLALARNPDQFAWLRANPAAVPAAAEELLRYDGPVQMTTRFAMADTTWNGHPIPAGTPVLAVIAAANRDPAVFPDPDRLDLARSHDSPPVRPHLAFGHGVHFCLGAVLARMELEALLTGLIRRVSRIELGSGGPEYKPNIVIRGPARLPMTLHGAG